MDGDRRVAITPPTPREARGQQTPPVPGSLAMALRVALVVVALAVFVSWGFLATHHVDDRYNVGWVEGTRVALVQQADRGRLYPPLYDGESYGGTRFMPVPILIHQGLARLTGEYLVSGKILAYLSSVLLLGLIFGVVRRLGCPTPAALAAAGGLLVTLPGLQAATTAQGDTFAVLVQLAAVTLVAARASRTSTVAAAALCTLGVLAKLSAVWAPLAIGVWLIRRDRRGAALFAGAFAAFLGGAVLVFQILTEGRMVANLGQVTLAGMAGASGLFRSPVRLVVLLRDVPLLLIVAPFALLGGALWRGEPRISIYQMSLVAAFLVLLVVLADEGTLHNHLLDLAVLMLVLTGDAYGRVSRATGALSPVSVTLAFLLVWAVGTSYLLELAGPTRAAAATLLRGVAPSRYDPQPLAGVIGPQDAALSEDPYVLVAMGRSPVVLDAWALLRLERNHPEWTEALARRIDRSEFDWIVLVYPIEFRDWYAKVHFGDSIASAIRDKYRLDREAHGYYVYVPAGTASPPAET